MLLPHMVCDVLVAGGWWSDAGQQGKGPGRGKLLEQLDTSGSDYRDVVGFCE